MNILSFGEVSHSYVTENPKKEVQKVETFKQREKAELNLSVTKIKTKELEGKLVGGKLVFDITDKKDIQEENILVTQGVPYKPNSARVRSANPTQILEFTKEANKLEVTGENLQDVYVNVLDNKGQLAGVYKNIAKKRVQNRYLDSQVPYANFKITDEFDNSMIYIIEYGKHGYRTSTNKGFVHLSSDGGYWEYYSSGSSSHRYRYWTTLPLVNEDIASMGEIWINGKLLFQDRKRTQEGYSNYEYEGRTPPNPPVRYKDEELDIEFIQDTYYQVRRYKLKLNKYPQKDFSIDIQVYGIVSIVESHRKYAVRRNKKINFKYVITTLKGNSTLTFAEYYPVNEFVQFTANPTIQNAQPLALDNSVRDVTLETTGKGLVAMQQGDKLTVDGHQVVIGAGGNIGPQKLTIGNVKYTYEVKNGKFRIALNEWGVLEPNRTIPIKIVRNENGSDKSLAEHNLTIKAPRKVAGTVNLKLNQDYNIRSFINFNGINLNAPGQASLEQPIAPGVSLTSVSGQGIPFMKEGDILQINDGLTRAVKSFTVGANGNLAKQKVRLNNGDVTIYVEAGKLRIGVDNWLVNKDIESQLRVLRGTNEIASHSFAIKAPEAPFNIKKNGLLDFGNVTSGTKRTAETDIVLEMLKDVTDIEFSLKDSQPVMENLTTGNRLVTDKLEYLVTKQGNREYKIKLKGKLTIPEATKSGSYTGNTVLELKIK